MKDCHVCRGSVEHHTAPAIPIPCSLCDKFAPLSQVVGRDENAPHLCPKCEHATCEKCNPTA